MADPSVYVPLSRLIDFAVEVLVKMGVPRADAEIAADVLLAADQYGVRSHGFAHLKMYYQRMKSVCSGL
jgi:LDH2 family malate/lactate/ureidoglycolate dehydrogenase